MVMKNKIKYCFKYIFSLVVLIGINIKDIFTAQMVAERIVYRYSYLSQIIDVRVDWLLTYPIHRIKGVVNIDEKKNSIKKNWINIYNLSGEKEKVLLLYLLYNIGIFDNEISEIVLGSICKFNNKNIRYWLTQNISKMTFFMQDGLYDDYFIDRKNLIKLCAEDMELNIPEKGIREASKKRLCIVTYLQSDICMNSIQRYCVMTAKHMKMYYDDIKVVVLDCFIVGEDDDHSICSLFNYKSARDRIELINGFYENSADVYFCVGNNYKEKFQDAINVIYEFNPDEIMDLSDEYSIISYFYSKDFYTMNMMFRVGATSLYQTSVIWDESGDIIRQLNKRYRFVQDEEIVNWLVPEVIPCEDMCLSRIEYNIGNDDFVLLTVGHCADIVTNKFVDCISEFLNKNNDCIWLIVGDDIPEYLKVKYRGLIDNGRVICRIYEKHIVSLCRLCDVLLRVDTTGGNGAAVIAAKNGLPIAMTDFYCDPMVWLGKDYSTIDNYQDLFDFIQKLHDDNGFYLRKKKEVYELVRNIEDSQEKWYRLHSLMKSHKKMVG